jgi:hypothetical protein
MIRLIEANACIQSKYSSGSAVERRDEMGRGIPMGFNSKFYSLV